MMNRTGATADHRAAVAAFVAKEKPVFQRQLTGRPQPPWSGTTSGSVAELSGSVATPEQFR